MKVTKGKFRPGVFWGILILHVLAVYGIVHAILFGFPMGAWVWFGVFYVVNQIGISLGYHRLFVHNAFKCGVVMRKILAGLGGTAVQGPLWDWGRTHRTHHAKGDKPGDPHTPDDGFWWSHCGWVFFQTIYPANYEPLKNFDMAIARWQRDRYWLFVASGFTLPFFAGCLSGLLGGSTFIGVLHNGWIYLLLAGPVRVVIHLHATWAVNSLGHTFGQVPKGEDGQPLSNTHARNCWWIVILTFIGEWAHGNHHADPNCAYFSRHWWEPELGKWLIRIWEVMGLVHEVKKPQPI